jgi:hypothetical protein
VWPDAHLIFDKPVRWAAVALRCGASWRDRPEDRGTLTPPIWELYQWVRDCAHRTCDALPRRPDAPTLTTVERWLYEIDRSVWDDERMRGRTDWRWSEYADAAGRVLR